MKQALLAVALALAFAGPAAGQGKGEAVKFQDYPGTGNMLVRIAISKGYCEKYGIKCAVQMIPSGPLGAQAMLAKSIESSFITPEIMIGAINKGAKMKMVTGGAVTNNAILIAGNHIETPNAAKGWPAFMQDLKGKKVGLPARGGAYEIMFTWMLNKAGMKAEDVVFVAVGAPNTAYGALMSKQVDGLVMFEPAGAICDLTKTCKVLWRGTDKAPGELYALNGGASVLVFTQDYIDKNPQVIEAVIKAMKDADAFYNNPSNFDETVKISLSYFRLEMPKGDEILTTVLRNALAVHAYVATIDRKAVQAGLDYLLATRQIEKAPPLSELVYDKAP
ncbi:MAG TPA: ABC transporter substrate-binding protein [Burkholderiales bacterium]|nr:ABC transporter substrate-binding protein [Burkholderiales bacterium]